MRILARRGRRDLAGAMAALIALAGCSSGNETPEESETAAVSDQSVVELVAGNPNLSTVSAGLGDTGLSQVLDGPAPYTLLAPDDAAFANLGEAGETLRSPEQRPAMAAVLRDHILPGYLTLGDIENGLEASNDGSVRMVTMGGHSVTFTAQGGIVTVATEDGATARLGEGSLSGANGVLIPIDGVLKATSAMPGE